MLELGFKEVVGESNSVSENRRKLKVISGNYNLPECLENEFQLMKSKAGGFYFCNAMKTADEAFFMKILKESKSSDDILIYRVYFGCAQNGTLLKNYLNEFNCKSVMGPSKSVMNPIHEAMSYNPKGAEIILDLVIENFEALEPK
jgi:hypothetical protein